MRKLAIIFFNKDLSPCNRDNAYYKFLNDEADTYGFYREFYRESWGRYLGVALLSARYVLCALFILGLLVFNFSFLTYLHLVLWSAICSFALLAFKFMYAAKQGDVSPVLLAFFFGEAFAQIIAISSLYIAWTSQSYDALFCAFATSIFYFDRYAEKIFFNFVFSYQFFKSKILNQKILLEMLRDLVSRLHFIFCIVLICDFIPSMLFIISGHETYDSQLESIVNKSEIMLYVHAIFLFAQLFMQLLSKKTPSSETNQEAHCDPRFSWVMCFQMAISALFICAFLIASNELFGCCFEMVIPFLVPAAWLLQYITDSFNEWRHYDFCEKKQGRSEEKKQISHQENLKNKDHRNETKQSIVHKSNLKTTIKSLEIESYHP